MRQGLCATSHPRKATSDLSAARILFPEYTTLLLGEDEIYSHWVTTSICEKTVRLQFFVGTTLLFFCSGYEAKYFIKAKTWLLHGEYTSSLPVIYILRYCPANRFPCSVQSNGLLLVSQYGTGGSDFLKCESEDRMDIGEIRAT